MSDYSAGIISKEILKEMLRDIFYRKPKPKRNYRIVLNSENYSKAIKILSDWLIEYYPFVKGNPFYDNLNIHNYWWRNTILFKYRHL